jgi:hypothetical protein
VNRRTNEEFISLTQSDSPIDFYYFISLLNFFDKNKDDLNLKELKIIVDKCEECRLYLNEDSTDPIEQEDVNPNIFYFYRLQLQKNNNNKEVEVDSNLYAIPA